MTEWEKTREREEFERAALIYKPMSLLMASRFHHAQYDDDKTDGVKLEAPKKVSSLSYFAYFGSSSLDHHLQNLAI